MSNKCSEIFCENGNKLIIAFNESELMKKKTICFRIEEAKRAIKRTSSDRYDDLDRNKRRNVETNDRRFEPPPPPRFDASIRSSNYDRATEKKRIDDYSNR